VKITKILIVVVSTLLIILGMYIVPNANEIKFTAPCNVLPKELRDVAKERGLSQVSNFYEIIDEVYTPPFVYGVDPKIRDRDSVAFWAQKLFEAGQYYLVVIVKDTNSEMHKCSSALEWSNPIGGLSIVEDYLYSPSEGFRFVNNPKKALPNMPKTSNAILSGSDEIDVLFFCYEGEWLFKVRH